MEPCSVCKREILSRQSELNRVRQEADQDMATLREDNRQLRSQLADVQQRLLLIERLYAQALSQRA